MLAVDRNDDRTRAVAKLVGGTVRAARGDQRARADYQAALELFSGLGLALEAAQARVGLARALGSHAPAAAVVEARHALETFERLGAARDADAAAALLRELGAPTRTFPRGYGAPLPSNCGERYQCFEVDVRKEGDVLHYTGHLIIECIESDRLAQRRFVAE